ncbi:hypothetical protein [Kutzneria albida]|uniref:Uncharacterized protein n=1 Tax=Kutzneria albida DSM 43870 TaxID=1449976 RepID=W5WD61_9PSEU|nr:hypothetical protein [Kutzneria albida]AHH98521.1 hypothetical protein KALB_5159 [Kutzneria albida DSM 43870]
MSDQRNVLDHRTVTAVVTAVTATVAALTFLFGFGNVWALALRLGVPEWIAPLIAPAVDLSVIGLLVGIRYLVLTGAAPLVLRPARRLLCCCSLATLALNVTDPLLTGTVGKALVDAVGPLLLIGWAEVGPGFLHAIATADTPFPQGSIPLPGPRAARDGEDLLARARAEDAWHRHRHQRPISAEALRLRLRVGAARSRELVSTVRSEHAARQRALDTMSPAG